MRNITTPTKAVSFEDALRNLAAKLTGKPAASLPRTQEAVVQFMADNISSVKELTDAMAKELAVRLTQELAEAIVQEVMARLTPAEAIVQEVMARLTPAEAQEPQDGGPEDAPKTKTRKRTTKTD